MLFRLFANDNLINFFLKISSVAPAVTKKIVDYTDSELIARYLRDQNTMYFTVLYRRYAGKVFAKCISMLADD